MSEIGETRAFPTDHKNARHNRRALAHKLRYLLYFFTPGREPMNLSTSSDTATPSLLSFTILTIGFSRPPSSLAPSLTYSNAQPSRTNLPFLSPSPSASPAPLSVVPHLVHS